MPRKHSGDTCKKDVCLKCLVEAMIHSFYGRLFRESVKPTQFEKERYEFDDVLHEDIEHEAHYAYSDSTIKELIKQYGRKKAIELFRMHSDYEISNEGLLYAILDDEIRDGMNEKDYQHYYVNRQIKTKGKEKKEREAEKLRIEKEEAERKEAAAKELRQQMKSDHEHIVKLRAELREAEQHYRNKYGEAA